jgi:hypothetical protein
LDGFTLVASVYQQIYAYRTKPGARPVISSNDAEAARSACGVTSTKMLVEVPIMVSVPPRTGYAGQRNQQFEGNVPGATRQEMATG